MLSRMFMTSAAAAAATTTNVVPSSSIISLTAPNPTEAHAAVLVPLCNVDDVPGVLLEVRGRLRTHSGEVRYVLSKTDSSFLAAALRETHEEVGILPAQIDVLGQLGPAEQSLGGLRVWPYVGFIHPQANSPSYSPSFSPQDSNAFNTADIPLPSISITSLTISQPEVATVFHLPLTAFTASARLKYDLFHTRKPYWAIDVSDLLPPGVQQTPNPPERGDRKEGRLEVWGLTGWYLSLLMKVLKVYK
ncbi:hypothetical protein BU15DRAFT_85628 [Melanogaster broomeanus]|nr:hypothetical protein BU15DRAFT_85628 [Melanogaster broomeanus]